MFGARAPRDQSLSRAVGGTGQMSRSKGRMSASRAAARAECEFIPPHVVPPTRNLVLGEAGRGRGGVADDHLLPSTTADTADDPGIVGGLAAAPAQGLDLEHLHPVGELDEPLAAREELGAEVRGDPEGMDVDVELIDNACTVVPICSGR